MTEAPAPAKEIDAVLGYRFRDRDLVETALSHSSWAHEEDGGRGNERLEFLGDAVVGMVVADMLYRAHPDWNEGQLTRARAALVNRSALADSARALDLGRFIKLGRTEQRSAGEGKSSILANCFESLVGAVFLDGGLAPVASLCERVFGVAVTEATAAPRDAKTRLQEWSHAEHGITPSYRTISDSGVEGDAERFGVEVRIGERVVGRGVGRSKRVGERAAAKAALESVADAGPRDG